VPPTLIGLNLYTGAIDLDEDIDPAAVVAPAYELQRVSLGLTAGRRHHRHGRQLGRLWHLPWPRHLRSGGRFRPVHVHGGRPSQ